jgi:hypothetical protein
MVGCNPSGYLQDFVNFEGWDKAKQHPQVRRLLQDLGLSARNLFSEDFWVYQALKEVTPSHKVVISDVRFKNEAECIQALDGQVWRIKRNGVGAVNAHVSESEMDGYPVDQIFTNNETIEDLTSLVKSRMGLLNDFQG